MCDFTVWNASVSNSRRQTEGQPFPGEGGEKQKQKYSGSGQWQGLPSPVDVLRSTESYPPKESEWQFLCYVYFAIIKILPKPGVGASHL
jgi:hypothetical protein